MGAFIYLLAGSPFARSGQKDPYMRAFFQEIKKDRPRVAYIGTASGDSLSFFDAISRRLRTNGAGEVELAPLCGLGDEPSDALRIVDRADALFVSGGDVAEGMDGLRARPEVAAALRARFDAGTPFMGLSAGSVMLARAWVRWADTEDGTDALIDCLGLAPIYCDVHGEEDGWDELKALLRLLPAGTVGYAIRAGGALRVCDGIVEGLPG